MKWLKIIGLGVAMWGLSLIWLQVNELLTSPVVLGLIIGLAIMAPAYLLGQHIGRRSHRSEPASRPQLDRTRPALVFARKHHSLPTRPMPVVKNPHSRPTRPMPITSGR
jgi:hypothetical protein